MALPPKKLKNIGKGDMKKGSAKGTEKKWSWMVSLYRPWQDPIGQGHGEWNGNRERLYGMAMGCPGRAKIAKNKSKASNYEDFGSRLVQIDFRLGRSP